MRFPGDDQRADFHAEPAGKPGRATGGWDGDGEAPRPVGAAGREAEAGATQAAADPSWTMSTGLMRRYNG